MVGDMKIKGHWVWSLGLVFLLLRSQVWAGPPFLTDDPDPVDFQHWEFYVAGDYAQTSLGATGTGQFEMNYGAFPDVHLHAVITGAFNAPNGQSVLTGTGDTEIGFKFLFL